jgi:FKBP-type peptidyl-prolyl cis-trans isomerase 2
MKAGDFVEVDYVGRVKETGNVFDLTREDVAKKENVYNPEMSYNPVVLIVGADFIIKGLDEALRGMKVGEKKNVEIPSDKAFGPRKEEMVKLIPESRFKEQNLDPVPGAVVNIGMMRGLIVTASGGRVKVDFNHPLAGKTLEYEIEIKSQITEQKDKLKSIVTYFTGVDEVDVKLKGKVADVEIKKQVDITRPVKSMVANVATKWADVGKVRFVEVFEGMAPATGPSLDAKSDDKKDSKE